MGLRLRLNLLLSLIFITTLGVGTAVLFSIQREGVHEELTASVEQAAKLIAMVVNQLPADISEQQLQSALNAIVNIGATRHLRISASPYTNSVETSEQLVAPQWFFQFLAPDPVGLLRVIDLRSKQRQVILRADYTLKHKITGEILDKGFIKNEGSYNRIESEFGTYSAQEASIKNMTKDMAESFKLRLMSAVMNRMRYQSGE